VRRDLVFLCRGRFLLLFCARTSATLGISIGPVALAFGILGLPNATPTNLSLVLAVQSVTMVAFLLFGGVIADRFPRYRVMMSSDLGSAAAWLVIAVMLLSGWAPVPVLAVVAGLVGLAEAMVYPSMTGLVPEVAPAEHLQAANGLLRLGTNSARVLGYALAGALVALIGPGWALVVNAGAFALSAVLLSFLRLPRLSRTRTNRVLADLREGWREFSSREWIWVVVLQYAVVMAGFQAVVGVLGPVIAQRELGGAPAWSLVLGGESLGMLAGAVVVLRIRPRRPILVGVLLTFPLAAMPVLLGLRAPLWAVVAGAFTGGLSVDFFAILWETTLKRVIPAAALSRVSAYDALGTLMFGPLGLVAAGPVAAALGPRHALFVAAAAMVVPTGLALLSPGVRDLRTDSDQPSMPVVVPAQASRSHVVT
jgi:MFS family permease